jgi:hypothetical protein
MIKRVIGFMFGFVIAICAGIAMLPKAHGAVPPHIHGVLPMLLAIDSQGNIVGAKLLGVTPDMTACGEIQKQAQAQIAEMTGIPGATVIVACVDMRADNGTTS